MPPAQRLSTTSQPSAAWRVLLRSIERHNQPSVSVEPEIILDGSVEVELPTVVLPVLSRVESPAPEAAPSPVMVRSSSDVSISGDYDDDAEVFIEPRPPSPVSAMGVGQWY